MALHELSPVCPWLSSGVQSTNRPKLVPVLNCTLNRSYCVLYLRTTRSGFPSPFMSIISTNRLLPPPRTEHHCVPWLVFSLVSPPHCCQDVNPFVAYPLLNCTPW